MSLSIKITGNTPDELREAVTALAAAFGGPAALQGRLAGVLPAASGLNTGGVSVTMVVDPPREDPPDTPQESAPVDTTPADNAPQESAPTVAANVKKELTPREMRSAGSDMLMQLFNRDPATLPALKKIQAKYGVKKFEDLPDEKAQAFYADAMLLANGTGEVAA